MRKYELVVVVKSSVKDADRKKLLETVKGWVKDLKLTKEEDWGQKPLAYEIKHESAGHYVMMQFEGENGVAKDFEQRLFQHDDVLRHLLLRTK